MVWEVQFHTSASLILNDNMPTSVKSNITTALTIMVTVLWFVNYQITCCITSQKDSSYNSRAVMTFCFFKQPTIVSCEKSLTVENDVFSMLLMN